jgi:signal transduction histidine kinase
MLHKKRLSATYTVAPDFPPVFSDRTKLRQILLNLLSNAIKFTQQGWVRLEAEQVADRLVMRVSDTGIGIKPEHLDAIWEDFRQIDQSRTREFGGTGLGLSITRKLLDRLSGTVKVSSEYGVGTTFTISMPMRLTIPAEEPPRTMLVGTG